MRPPCRPVHPTATRAGHAATYGLAGFVAGTNDLEVEMRCRPGPGRGPLLPLLAMLVVAARSADLAVLDGVCNALGDAPRIEAECRQALEYGFDGKTLIHPSQVEVANRVFTPTDEDVARMRTVVETFARPENATRGAIRIEGRMVERLHLVEAERVLAMAELGRQPEGRSQEPD